MTDHNYQLKKNRFGMFLIPVLLALLILNACSPPTQVPAQPPTSTSSQVEEGEMAESPAPPSESTAPPAATLTASPLPTLATTPAPIANITGNTNCRTGPGSVYDLLHTYLAGNQVELLGVSPDGFFWYTRGSSVYAPDCWLWGQYVTPMGDTTLVPVFTPPPTPTLSPDFEITYFNYDGGAGQFVFYFEINNIGNVAWDSALLYLFDPVVPQDAGRFSNTFLINGVPASPTQDHIPAGGTAYFHSERLSNPGGYGKQPGPVDIYFLACTQEYLGGYCVAKMWSEELW